MDRLSTALSIDLTKERAAVYWDALCDLPLDAVVSACQFASRHWKPTPEERKPFPVPATLREYAQQYQRERVQQAAEEARKLLPQWGSTDDEVGLAAIRKVLDTLGEDMRMLHPVYQSPSLDNPEKRREELREQVRLIQQQAHNIANGKEQRDGE